MKKVLYLLFVTVLMVGMGLAQAINSGSVAAPFNSVASSTVGPAGTITSSGLTITVLPGELYCNGELVSIHNTQFTLPANSTTFVGYNCANNFIYARALNSANPPAEINFATVVTGASTVSGTTDLRAAINFPSISDGYAWVPLADCAWTITGTAGTNNNTIQNNGASNTPALLMSTTGAGANTGTLTCHLARALASKITTGKGVTINDAVITYGVQTTALTSVGAPTIGTILMPTPGTGETPSTVTPVSAGGSLTVTPVIGSANLGLTTAGAFFTEKIALGTPLALATDLTDVVLTQTFVQSAAAAQIVNINGVQVHFSNVAQ